MKRNKVARFLAMAMACTMMIGTSVTAFAANNYDGTDVTIQIKGQSDDPTKGDENTDDWTNVTVPSVLPLVFEVDGSNNLDPVTLTPENFKIVNNTPNADVYMKSMQMETKAGGDWKIAAADQDIAAENINTKTIRLHIGIKGEQLMPINAAQENETTGKWEASDPSNMVFEKAADLNNGTEKVMDFQVDRTAFVTKDGKDLSGSAYTLHFNFGFLNSDGSAVVPLETF